MIMIMNGTLKFSTVVAGSVHVQNNIFLKIQLILKGVFFYFIVITSV